MATISINGREYSGSSVIVTGDSVFIDGVCQGSGHDEKELVLNIAGDVNIKSDRSVRVNGDVNGNVECKGSVSCKNIRGTSVKSGGSVNCDDISGSVSAGGSINCDEIKTG